MKTHYHNPAKPKHGAGFTLVEMLISVTLVLLMMTMFTAIFQMATNSISKQRSISENDQRARALTTNLRADIAKRSFRYVLPFYPGEVSGTSATDFGDRAGYLYISTNDPDSWQDDLLQFTVDVRQTEEDPDETRYFGSAGLLYDFLADPSVPGALGATAAPRRTTLRVNTNQPDADDSNLQANGVGGSSAAEISYFIRNGNLYRRVMLLREPLPVAGEDLNINPRSTVTDNSYVTPAPLSGGGTNNFGGIMAVVGFPQNITFPPDPDDFVLASPDAIPASWNVQATNDFWRHFDYSAVPTLAVGSAPTVLLPDGLNFVGLDALDNSTAGLGTPSNRFGFNSVTGLSREHDNSTDLRFIGRFTHAETSHPDFNWPMAACRNATLDTVTMANTAGAASGAYTALNTGALIGNGNPMDLVGTALNLNQTTGVLSEFAGTTGRGGPRMVEDLLLANVHGMKVEIWDERLQDYVTPRHASLTQILDAGGTLQTIAGDYHNSRNLNTTYGPLGTGAPASNRVFDTWNPAVGGGATPPPFIPYRYYPPRQGDAAVVAGGSYGAPCGPGPTPNTAPNPYFEYDRKTGLNQKNKGYWVPSDDSTPGSEIAHVYNVGDIVFARVADTNGNGVFDWGIDNVPGTAFHIAFECISTGYSAFASSYAGSGQPSWPSTPGQVFQEATESALAGTPARWRAVDNRQPLKSIRVTVQLYGQKTEALRQLTLVLPLTTDR